MIRGILALGPLVIIGAALLHAAEATRGLLHLRIQNTDLERGPTPAHLWTADQEVGALMRMDIADRLEERGLFLSAVEAVKLSRATAVNPRMVAYLLCLSEPYVFSLDYHSQHQRSIVRLFAVRISLEDTERGSPILSRWTMTTIAAPGPLLRVFIGSFVV